VCRRWYSFSGSHSAPAQMGHSQWSDSGRSDWCNLNARCCQQVLGRLSVFTCRQHSHRHSPNNETEAAAHNQELISIDCCKLNSQPLLAHTQTLISATSHPKPIHSLISNIHSHIKKRPLTDCCGAVSLLNLRFQSSHIVFLTSSFSAVRGWRPLLQT
jgi:hypothetical protein